MFCGRQGTLFIPALHFSGRREKELLAEQAPQLSRQRSPPARTHGEGEWEGQNVSLQEREWEAVKKLVRRGNEKSECNQEKLFCRLQRREQD